MSPDFMGHDYKSAEDDVSLRVSTRFACPWSKKGAEDDVSLCMLPDFESDG